MTTTQKPESVELDVSGGGDVDETIEPNSASDKFLNTFAKIIPKLFIAVGIGVLALWITGFVTDTNIVWGIFVVNIGVSLFGAWAVYQYGVIQEQIDRLKEQNEAYENEIDKLKETRQKLKTFVDELNSAVKNLQGDADKLNEQTKQFEPLIEELKKVAGDNKEINDIINQTNKIFSDMKTTVLENERAHLLSTYYDCAFRDDDNKMSKREYKKFLTRLTREQRDKFNKLGTFEELAGEDNEIDLDEMQKIIDKILQDLDVLLKEKLKN